MVKRRCVSAEILLRTVAYGRAVAHEGGHAVLRGPGGDEVGFAFQSGCGASGFVGLAVGDLTFSSAILWNVKILEVSRGVGGP